LCSSSVSEGAVVDDRTGHREHVEGDGAHVLVRGGEVDGGAVVDQRRGAVGGLAHLPSSSSTPASPLPLTAW
jgi:hypothetical protein